MKINADDLKKKKKNSILETCISEEIKKVEKKIIMAHELKKSYISYQVQKPLNQDYTQIIKAVNNELIKNKFKTSIYDDGTILISW